MSLINFWHKCENCNTTFKSPHLSDFSYGEFLLRNQSNDIAYLNAIECKEFKEFSNLVKENKLMLGKDEDQRVDIFQNIFGMIADQSEGIDYYSIRRGPKCPNCGQTKYKHWGPTNPPEIVDVDIKTLTFHKWNSLTNEQKKDRVDESLKLFLSSKKECDNI